MAKCAHAMQVMNNNEWASSGMQQQTKLLDSKVRLVEISSRSIKKGG